MQYSNLLGSVLAIDVVEQLIFVVAPETTTHT